MDEHCRGCIRYLKSCSGMSKAVCEKHQLRIPRTNADRIRAMTDEELSEYLAERSVAPSCTGKCHKDHEVYGELRTFCHNCWLEWLKQEAKE